MKRLHWLATAAGTMVACMAAEAAAPSLDGVWTLAKPQRLLTPADRAPIPFTEKGRTLYEKHNAQVAKGDYSFDMTMSRCSSPGVPRAMLLPGPFRLFQRPDMVLATFQWNHLSRQINLHQGPPLVTSTEPDPEGLLQTKMGNATGRWEGNTLVVQTVNLTEEKLLDDLLPNSEQLEVTERFQLRGNMLEDRITIKDPEYYTRSWDVVLTYKKLPDSDFPFAEDTCLDRRAAGKPALPR